MVVFIIERDFRDIANVANANCGMWDL